MSQIVGPIIHI